MLTEEMYKKLDRVLKKIEPDIRGQVRWFGRIAVIFQWSCKIEMIKKVDYLLKWLPKNMRKAFSSWIYEIEIKLIETEVS
ncbi:hypothetical protein ES708_25939 [subsurface metagenome]